MYGLVWLASYPKSGNTWFRAFLTNLIRGDGYDLDINTLIGGPIASSREVFDELVGYDSSNLTKPEIDQLYPEVYARMALEAQKSQTNVYYKIHNANLVVDSSKGSTPSAYAVRTIYLVRNPLDIAISFANHLGWDSLDHMICQMANPNFTLASNRKRFNNQLCQTLSSWSGHVESWLAGIDNHNVFIIKYEDMLKNPQQTFSDAVNFLQLPYSSDQIRSAIQNSEFYKLQKLEQSHGFRERPEKSRLFFRKGTVGTWQDTLSESQIEMVINEHATVMRRLGYLSESF